VKIGLISDIHLGYNRGSKVNANGVNVREQDFIDAGFTAVTNLKNAGVEMIVDGGDMADFAAPKKRAIQALIDLVNFAEVPYISADGNHTSIKSAGDIHLYDILSNECPNFYGAVDWKVYLGDYKVALIPHSYDYEVTIRRIDEAMGLDPDMLVGHFAASDIVFDKAQVPLQYLPQDIPVFLGHYHRHTEQDSPYPNYIGSTEKTAWDQFDYPTGVTTYDTETGKVGYIQHNTRPYVDIWANPDNYLDMIKRNHLEDALVRVTVNATRAEYGAINTREAKKAASQLGALAFHIRRAKDKGQEESRIDSYEAKPVEDAWVEHASTNKLSKQVTELGMEALNA
jgi:DNA repair exonuclease SbcCD nuclease subunit